MNCCLCTNECKIVFICSNCIELNNSISLIKRFFPILLNSINTLIQKKGFSVSLFNQCVVTEYYLKKHILQTETYNSVFEPKILKEVNTIYVTKNIIALRRILMLASLKNKKLIDDNIDNLMELNSFLHKYIFIKELTYEGLPLTEKIINMDKKFLNIN